MDSPFSASETTLSSPMAISPLHSPASSCFAQSLVPDYDSAVLAMGILAGNVAHVEALVRLGATISERDRWTLYQACLVGSDMVQALILSPQISSAICSPSESGDAIVHWVLRTPCTRFGTSKQYVIELLWDQGADLFEPDRLGDTCLHVLAAMPEEGNAEILRSILSERGRTPCLDNQNHYGDTALIIAVICNHFEAATLLLSFGADPNIKGEHGMVAMHYAVQQRNLEMLALLQQYGAENGEEMVIDGE